jgi:beta-barrel assembly-enhancing protease
VKETSRREFLDLTGRCAALGIGLSALYPLFFSGCKELGTMADIGTGIGVASGTISPEQADSIRKSAKAVARTFEDFTPEQEYYIGRTIGAMILEKYPAYPDESANRYLNVMGKTLALASDMPETFGGYHFLIQDSGQVNGLSAPGGLVFITRGMLRCCRSEDAVAAVLAHEIGHVQMKHGLQAIKKSRVTTALTTLGIEGAKTFGGEDLAGLTRTFEDSVTDITQTLINNGYSRGFEREADMAAVTLMNRVGYDPNGLTDMLKVMAEKLVPGRPDFARTHPAPAIRIAEIEKVIGRHGAVTSTGARQARFRKNLGGI